MTLRFVLVISCAAFACSRTPAGGTDAAASASSSSASSSSTSPALLPDAALEDRAYVAVAGEEAKRALTTKLEERAKAHFTHDGGALPTSFETQTVDLSIQGRRAILVAEAGKGATDARPFLQVVEADGTLVWSKDRPHAGIMAPVGQLAIAPAPRGRVSQAACDPPTTTVALRLWDHDGFPFADFQALSVDACDELALLYWPKRGFLIVAARSGATTAQLLDEEGKLTWSGSTGVDLGTRAKTPMAPAMVVDRVGVKREEESFLLVQGGMNGEGQPHAYAFRYDVRAVALWQAALDLGPIPPNAKDRPSLRRTADGVVAATLPGGLQVEIKSTGESTVRGRAPR